MQRNLWIAVALSAAAWGAQAAGEGYRERPQRSTGAEVTSPSVPAERGRPASPHGRTMRSEGGMSSPSGTMSPSAAGGANGSGIEDRQLRSALDTCADHPREQRADCAHRAFEMMRGDAATGSPGTMR